MNNCTANRVLSLKLCRGRVRARETIGKVICLLEFWKSIFEFWVEKSNLKRSKQVRANNGAAGLL